MGRYIPEQSQAAHVFSAVHSMFYEMVNKPTVDRQGRLDDGAFDSIDLKVASELLNTLERLYPLREGRNVNPTSCGVQTEQMLSQYVQMKYWQKMLNAIYGPKAPQ